MPRSASLAALALSALLPSIAFGFLDQAPPTGLAQGPPPNTTVWYDALALFPLLGRGWPSTAFAADQQYTRLPSHAQSALCSKAACAAPCSEHDCTARRCDVWGLSQTATGLHFQFKLAPTTTEVHVRFTMDPENGDWLWAFNGHSGVDMYVQDGDEGPWRWATSSGNNAGNAAGSMAASALSQHNRTMVFTATLGAMAARKPGAAGRNVMLYLPSRGALKKVEIGVGPPGEPAPAALAPPPPPDQRQVVFYGTSILHGAASGRAGMVYSSQIQRLLGMPVINLGFSGHGLMQQELADLLAEVPARIYVLDCEYNMVADDADRSPGWPATLLPPGNASTVACNTYNFIKRLRAAQPKAKVLLIEGHDDTTKWMNHGKDQTQNTTRNGYRAAFNRLLEEGMDDVFYLDGSRKLGGPIDRDFESQAGPIAGCHVSNFAFKHFATYIGDKVKHILNGTEPAATPVPLLPVSVSTATGGHGTQGKITKWMDAWELGLEGLGWRDEVRGTSLPYARFPPRAQAAFANCSACAFTYNLSACGAGVLARFETNADTIQLKISRQSLGIGLLSLTGRQDDIMPYNGRFGIDIHAQDEQNGENWRWFGTSAGSAHSAESSELFSGLRPRSDGRPRRFTLFFPTHIPVSAVKVGVPAGASLTAYAPHAGQKPVAIWASSIGQGGVVQNAGMMWISNVGRLLDREVLNFGLSGNCLMQPEVAELLVELKPAALLVDCLPNMNAELVAARAPALFRQLRAGLGPEVPILILEGHTYSNAWLLPTVAAAQQAKRAAQRTAFDEAAKSDKHIHYLAGDDKLAGLGDAVAQSDATSGIGVHPTNIAHLHMAEFVASALKPLLLAADEDD